MLSIYDTASAACALNQRLEPALRTLLEGRLADAAAIGLSELTHLIVVQANDSEAALIDELGWSPLVNPIDGTRYGDPDFLTFWSWLEDLGGGWFEIVHTIGNAGFAVLMLVQQDAAVLPELLRMCQEYCGCGEQQCAF